MSQAVSDDALAPLTWAAYTQAVERTARGGTDTTRQQEQLTNFALGLAGEAGEVVDLVKKHVFHDHVLDRVHLAEELGDVLWYVAALASTLGIPLEDIATANVVKLLARYPNGFDAQRSRDRD